MSAEPASSSPPPPSLSPPGSPPRRPPLRAPLFSPPTMGEPPASPGQVDGLDLDGEAPGSAPPSADSMPEPESPPTVSRPLSPVDRRQLQEAIRQGVRSAGGLLNETVTRDELELNSGLYLTDEQDENGLAVPLAEIIGRRGDLGAAAANPDLADALRALIALAVYIAKQLNLIRHLRRVRRVGLADQTGHLSSNGQEGSAT